jgi:hypothetical protein
MSSAVCHKFGYPGKERPGVRRKPVCAYWRMWYSVFNGEMRVPPIRDEYAYLQPHPERERGGGRIQSPWAKSKGGGVASFPAWKLAASITVNGKAWKGDSWGDRSRALFKAIQLGH